MGHYNVTQPQENVSVETLFAGFCYLIDFTPNINGTDCSIKDPTKCIRCPIRGAFFTGESVNDYGSTALKYYYATHYLIVLVSILGLLNNTLILMVMKRRKNLKSFDILLIVLAGFDLFSSLCTIFSTVSSTSCFGNWFGRGRINLYFYYISVYSGLAGRSGSTLTTEVISIERFFIITFPLKARLWFTSRNSKILSFIIIFIVGLLNFPRYFAASVEFNEYQDIPSIQGLEFILKPTPIGKFLYGKVRAVHNQIDFWMPLPIILLFNVLSFWKVRQITAKRKELNASVKKEIGAIKMFLPVVLVYFMTNIGPIVFYILIQFKGRMYREMAQIVSLSIAINSVVNFPIYYWSSSVFRAEFRQYVGRLWSQASDMFQLCHRKDETTEKQYK